MSSIEHSPPSRGIKGKKRTIRIVRLVRKTSAGKLMVAGLIGLIIGGGAATWGTWMVCATQCKTVEQELAQEHGARVDAEDALYSKHLAMERMMDERAAEQSVADISRMNIAIPEPVQTVGGNDDLQMTSGSNPEEAKEWKSRYRYAAMRFNKLATDYSQLYKRYIELTGAGGATKGIVTGAQFYRFLRKENKQKLDHCWEEKKKGLRLHERQELERDERVYADRDSWLRRMAIRIGIEKV